MHVNAHAATVLDNVSDNVGTSAIMKMYNIQQDRRSQDVAKNNFGNAFIDLCISQRRLIVNGRSGRDADLGNLPVRTLALLTIVLHRSVFFHSFATFMLVISCFGKLFTTVINDRIHSLFRNQ